MNNPNYNETDRGRLSPEYVDTAQRRLSVVENAAAFVLAGKQQASRQLGHLGIPEIELPVGTARGYDSPELGQDNPALGQNDNMERV